MVASHSSSPLQSLFGGLFLLFCTVHLFFYVSSNNVAAEFSAEPINRPPPHKYLRIGVSKDEKVYYGRIYLGARSNIIFAMLSLLPMYWDSKINWFFCDPCDPCYPHTDDDIYIPGISSTYRKHSCIDNTYCDSLRVKECDGDNNCKFTLGNGNSSISGPLSFDRLRFANQRSVILTNFTFGCVREAHGPHRRPATSVIALGRNELSLVSQLGVRIFSYCLPPRGKSGWVDFGTDVNAPSPEAVTIPFVGHGDDSYKVRITSFTVEGQDPIVINPPHDIFSLDTFTPMTYVDPYTMERLTVSLKAAIPYPALKSMDPSLASNNYPYELCFSITTDDPWLPWIKVDFGHTWIFLHSTNYISKIRNDRWCVIFKSNYRIGIPIIGSQTLMTREIRIKIPENEMTISQFGIC